MTIVNIDVIASDVWYQCLLLVAVSQCGCYRILLNIFSRSWLANSPLGYDDPPELETDDEPWSDTDDHAQV